jgi:soluble lytic murein transglycosylase
MSGFEVGGVRRSIRGFRTAAAVSVIMLCLGATPSRAGALSADDEHLYKLAFDSAHKQHFDWALTATHKAHNKLLAKVLEWQYYVTPGSGAEFGEITSFMRANPDWPQQTTLERRAEEAITAATPKSAILDWFDQHAPTSVDGAMAYGKALLEQGRTDQAAELVRKFWVSGNFGQVQERLFLNNFEEQIRDEDDIARLDRLLWDHQDSAVRQQMSRVDADHKLLAQARLAFDNEASNAESLARNLPASVKDDPGLIYEWVRYRRNRDDDDGAVQLLRHPAHDQVRPDLWWTERAVLARRALQKGNVSVAYDIAQNHGQTDGAGFADAEWLSGWIALRFLSDATQGLDHFSRMYDHVVIPRSRSRAAYWAGRACEVLGQGDEAVRWFNLAAQNVTTFYGQLAVSRIHQDQLQALPPDPKPTQADITQFEQQEMTQAAHLLGQIKETDLVRPFMLRAIDLAQTPGERELAAKLAQSLGRPDIAVTVAKQSERQGVPLIQSGYPIVPSAGDKPEHALVLSLIRQESAFHADAVSGVGAKGLMQLMPATAAQIAKALKVAFKKKDNLSAQLTANPSLNVKLGSAYVGDLLNDFNGSYLLTAAAYNAGPGRVRHWLKDMGDPRTAEVDAVDWIESIPYWETRDYVQRVLEATQIYRRKLGSATTSQLERDIKR